MKNTSKRQGDVFLEPVNKIRGKRIPNKPVALGEVTGHSHRIVDIPEELDIKFGGEYGPNVLVLDNEANAKADTWLMRQPLSETMEMYQDEKGSLILKIHSRSAIVHEEHFTQVVEPGIYEYHPQKEYDPWKGLHNVID